MSQSSASNSAIESATRAQTGLFGAYVVILILGAVFTVFLFRAGNKVQEAIKADADARIKGADERIKQVESDAQVRIKQIEDNAETAKREAEQKIAESNATAQSAARDAAKARQDTAKLELEVATQRERAAKAEKDLLEIQERIKPRRITVDQRMRLVPALRQIPNKGPVSVSCILGDGEGIAFANQIVDVLKAADWPADGVNQGAYSPTNPIGAFIRVRDAASAPPYSGPLQQAFKLVGIELTGIEDPALAASTLEILIGNKP